MKYEDLLYITIAQRNPHAEIWDTEMGYRCRQCRQHGPTHAQLKEFWDNLLEAEIAHFWATASMEEVFDLIGERGDSPWGEDWALHTGRLRSLWGYTKEGKMATNEYGWFFTRRRGAWRRTGTRYDSGAHWFGGECCEPGHRRRAEAALCGKVERGEIAWFARNPVSGEWNRRDSWADFSGKQYGDLPAGRSTEKRQWRWCLFGQPFRADREATDDELDAMGGDLPSGCILD
jgi:hypothetical protein